MTPKEKANDIMEITGIDKNHSYCLLMRAVMLAKSKGIDLEIYPRTITNDEGFNLKILIVHRKQTVIYKTELQLNIGVKGIWKEKVDDWIEHAFMELLTNGFLNCIEAVPKHEEP